MAFQDTPDQCIVYFVITMYYPVAQVHDAAGTCDFYINFALQQLLGGFAYDFQFSFNCAFDKKVFPYSKKELMFEVNISIWPIASEISKRYFFVTSSIIRQEKVVGGH
jgi:hypothetical protein